MPQKRALIASDWIMVFPWILPATLCAALNRYKEILTPNFFWKEGPMKNRPKSFSAALAPNHIFNLGHGVIKETPPEHVAELVAFVKSLRE